MDGGWRGGGRMEETAGILGTITEKKGEEERCVGRREGREETGRGRKEVGG